MGRLLRFPFIFSRTYRELVGGVKSFHIQVFYENLSTDPNKLLTLQMISR